MNTNLKGAIGAVSIILDNLAKAAITAANKMLVIHNLLFASVYINGGKGVMAPNDLAIARSNFITAAAGVLGTSDQSKWPLAFKEALKSFDPGANMDESIVIGGLNTMGGMNQRQDPIDGTKAAQQLGADGITHHAERVHHGGTNRFDETGAAAKVGGIDPAIAAVKVDGGSKLHQAA